MSPRATTGSLLGTALGDSLGLPFEGLSPRRAARMFDDPLRHHLLPGLGMVSDDTEHACFTARALLLAGDDVDAFGRHLAASLRWWFLGLPAGIGLATLRAILKSCVGFPPDRSGVFSAGNGPAMRSPIIGVACGHEPERMKAFVRRSTRITHTDPKAYDGALAVAQAAHLSASGAPISPESYIRSLHALGVGEEMATLARHAAKAAAADEPVGIFAAAIGSRGGISGYMLHTIPCVLHVWFRHPDDIAAGLREIIGAGGDTDTTAAIYGGIVGARVGRQGLPDGALQGIADWPRSIGWIQRLGDALGQGGRPPGYFVPGIPVRNALFMAIVLAHGFRRLAPPY